MRDVLAANFAVMQRTACANRVFSEVDWWHTNLFQNAMVGDK